MTTQGTMTWEQAALHVLQEAAQPMHYVVVAEKILEDGLTRSVGAKPSGQANVALNSLFKDGKIAKLERGLYALSEVADSVKQEIDAAEADAEAAAENPARLTVKAYGLYWDRSFVDWTSSKGQLWGQQSTGATPVDFADQDGIYMLHKGSEIAYVGQTLTPLGNSGLYQRLRDHHTHERRTHRWDAFSWYGFRGVQNNGELAPSPETGSTKDVINTIEAMFIEALMPRLNMRAGEETKELIKTGLYAQTVVQSRWGR